MANCVAYIMTLCLFSWFHKIVSENEKADCGKPPYGITIHQDCLEQLNATTPTDHKEGAMIVYTCRSLLWRTATTIDYCPVEKCEPNRKWRPAEIFCGSDECFNVTSGTYKGRRTCSVTGKMCRRWDVQTLESRPYTDGSSFPDKTLKAAKNYCRDPGNTRGEPWCYTEPDNAIENCGIPECSTVEIGQGTCPESYCGNAHEEIITDNGCIKIDPPNTTAVHLNVSLTYRCVSLLVGFTTKYGYCPIQKCMSDFHWRKAHISCGDNECYTDSTNYAGKRRCTKDGWDCQRWDFKNPHSHEFWTEEYFPGLQIAEVRNFCRDPGGVQGEPWCYTTNPDVVNQTCAIPLCSSITIDNGTCEPVQDANPDSAPSTTQATVIVPSTPKPQGGLSTYIRTNVSIDRDYEFQYLVPTAQTPISCAQRCAQESVCRLFTIGKNAPCTLYSEKPGEATESVECDSKRCYYKMQ